ncbi:MAG: leucyl aminopeptidase [Acidimicrobiia bacterium]
MIDIAHASELDTTVDVAVVPVLAGVVPIDGDPFVPDLGALGSMLEARDFTGKAGQCVFVPSGTAAPETLLVGLGDDVDLETLRRAAGSAAKAIGGYTTCVTTMHRVGLDGAAGAVAMGFWLGAYSFDEYKSEPKARALARITLVGGDDVTDELMHAKVVSEGVVLARDLVNRPAIDKAPAVLADIATGLADNITVTVHDEEAIAEAGFGGLIGVNRGADRPARMVVMEYRPQHAAKTVAFVGKGIVFDSGGLSIKTAAGMETMKTDMAGAAAVFGAIRAIARMGLPVNVVGITPLTENLTGGSAQRPGDVLTAYNGKTIEVLNTDAEGRLVLADGLSLAAEMGPDLIVDIATLTGACKVALGPTIGGFLTDDEEAANTVAAAAQAAGEKLWRLPLESEYAALIESDVADMKNTGGRWGGTITAALLLREFTGEVPWVHLDVAGPARADKAEHYVSKGGSGFGVRTLVAIAEGLAR